MELLAERAREHELPEEHEAYLRAARAHGRVDSCGACGRSLLSGEPVHFGAKVYVGFPPIRWHWWQKPRVCEPRYQRTVLCGSCSPGWLSPGKGDVVAQLCASCERPMVYRLTASTMRRTFCTEACGRTYHNRLRNQRRKEGGTAERKKVCEACGEGLPRCGRTRRPAPWAASKRLTGFERGRRSRTVRPIRKRSSGTDPGRAFVGFTKYK